MYIAQNKTKNFKNPTYFRSTPKAFRWKNTQNKSERETVGWRKKKGLQLVKLNFSHSRNKLLSVERSYCRFSFRGGAYFPSVALFFFRSEHFCNCPSHPFFTKATLAKLREGFRSFIYCWTVLRPRLCPARVEWKRCYYKWVLPTQGNDCFNRSVNKFSEKIIEIKLLTVATAVNKRTFTQNSVPQ